MNGLDSRDTTTSSITIVGRLFRAAINPRRSLVSRLRVLLPQTVFVCVIVGIGNDQRRLMIPDSRPVKSDLWKQHLGTLQICIKSQHCLSVQFVGVASPPVQCFNTGLKKRNQKCEILMQPINAPRCCSRHSDLTGLPDSWYIVNQTKPYYIRFPSCPRSRVEIEKAEFLLFRLTKSRPEVVNCRPAPN